MSNVNWRYHEEEEEEQETNPLDLPIRGPGDFQRHSFSGVPVTETRQRGTEE